MSLDNNTILMNVCESCGIEFTKVQPKVSEILRKMSLKFPYGTLQSQYESIRYILATEISCRLLNITFNKQSFIKLSHLKDNDYQKGINMIKAALHLGWEKMSVIDLLAIHFGTTFKTVAQQLLQRYESKYNTLHNLKLSINVINSPAYEAAAFFLSLKQRKVSKLSIRLSFI